MPLFLRLRPSAGVHITCVLKTLLFHKNMECSTDNLELVTNTFGKDIVIGVECIFTWYWIADFCDERGIDFALRHAYYMKSIHGGKTKSDKTDSEKNCQSASWCEFLKNNR